MRPKVIVFLPYCPGSIGEQVVQLPFFHFLRRLHPEDEIVGIAPGASGAVVEALAPVDRMISHPQPAGPRVLARLARKLFGMRCRQVFQLRRKSLRTGLLARLAARAPVSGFSHGWNGRLLDTATPFDTGRYIAESYAAVLGRTVADFAAEHPHEPGGYALIVPGGRTEVKRYPRYLEVARALSSPGPVRFLLGPDREQERAILRECGGRFEVDFAPPFSEMRRIVRGASVVIANDCGPAHLAHVYDVPRVSLFDTSVDPAHWFSPGRRGKMARAPGPGRISEISPEEVLALAREAQVP